MDAYVFHRVIHMFQGGTLDIYTLDILSGSLTNKGMVPASIFDILTRSALTVTARRGSDLR